jgi:hypothetical protein
LAIRVDCFGGDDDATYDDDLAERHRPDLRLGWARVCGAVP